MIGCYALGCHHGSSTSEEYFPATKSLNKAIDDCYREGILGPKLLGGDYALDLTVHSGAGAISVAKNQPCWIRSRANAVIPVSNLHFLQLPGSIVVRRVEQR